MFWSYIQNHISDIGTHLHFQTIHQQWAPAPVVSELPNATMLTINKPSL